jgi:hypothetical protein
LNVVAIVPLLWSALAAQVPDSALMATFSAIRSASARFRHDLRQASPQLVMTRARDVRAACNGSRAAADSLAPRVARHPAARAELGALQRALAACEREWDTTAPRANPDSLRAWGPHRLNELDRALRRYQQRGRAA